MTGTQRIHTTSHGHPRYRVLALLPVAPLVFGAVTLSAETPPRVTLTGNVVK
jgi:hypothetical protein